MGVAATGRGKGHGAMQGDTVLRGLLSLEAAGSGRQIASGRG